MQIRANDGWIRAGLAVLVTGVLGGGVMTVARDSAGPRKITADGVARPAAEGTVPARPVDLAATPAAATADHPAADPVVGDKIMVGTDGGSVTVSAVEDNVSAGRLFGAGEGNKYIAAEVTGCSGPHEKNLSFDASYFLLMLDDGTMRDHGPGAKKPELQGGAVPAGKCLSGWVTFVVPDGALARSVLYDGSSRLTWTVPLPKGAHPTTTTTARAGATTTSTTGARATTTTTRSAATAKATSAATTSTTSKSPTTTTTRKATPTTATTARSATTTTARPAPTTSTTTASKPAPPATEPGAVTPAPTAPPG